MGIKNVVVKVWAQITEKTEQQLDKNVALTADVSIRQKEKLIESLFEQLKEMDVDITVQAKHKESCLKEVGAYQKLLDATLKSKATESEVTAALVKLDGAQAELDRSTQNLAKDTLIYEKLKNDCFDAQNKVKIERKNLKFLKARKKTIELQKKLVDSGTGLKFEDGEMSSLASLKENVEHEENLMNSHNKIKDEITGRDVLKQVEEIDLKERVAKLMKGKK